MSRSSSQLSIRPRSSQASMSSRRDAKSTSASKTMVMRLNHARKDIALVYTEVMFIAMLGRQPSIGMAELERVFGDVTWFSENSACIQAESFDVTRLGGTL